MHQNKITRLETQNITKKLTTKEKHSWQKEKLSTKEKNHNKSKISQQNKKLA